LRIKRIFAIDKITSQMGDSNFAFLIENLNFSPDLNPLATFGYPKFSLNFAATGTLIDGNYQLRNQISVPDAFKLQLWANLDPTILDIIKAATEPDIASKIRQVVLEYNDLSLLQRVYQRFGADQIKMSGQQMIASMAQRYGLDKNPAFAANLAALQRFIAAPSNIRLTLQPQAGVDIAKIAGLALANPVELALQLQLQIQAF
jgi:hypothetical protein